MAVYLALLTTSSVHLYRGAFPERRGGTNSLIYFGEIAKQQESEFLHARKSRSSDALVDDRLGQAWRNSSILCNKFDSLERAYRYMALSAIPWVLSTLSLALGSFR